MVKPLTVTEATCPLAVAPAPDLTIDLVGFGFDLSGPISLRFRTFKAINQGQQDHEAFLVKLAPGATTNDFVAAFSPGAPPGPPPGQGLGGFQAIAAGGAAHSDIISFNQATMRSYASWKIRPAVSLISL